MTCLWIVRAGKQGQRELAAIEQGRILPGLLSHGDMSQDQDRDAILAHLEDLAPDESRNRLRNFAAQLNQFVNTMQIGNQRLKVPGSALAVWGQGAR